MNGQTTTQTDSGAGQQQTNSPSVQEIADAFKAKVAASEQRRGGVR